MEQWNWSCGSRRARNQGPKSSLALHQPPPHAWAREEPHSQHLAMGTPHLQIPYWNPLFTMAMLRCYQIRAAEQQRLGEQSHSAHHHQWGIRWHVIKPKQPQAHSPGTPRARGVQGSHHRATAAGAALQEHWFPASALILRH